MRLCESEDELALKAVLVPDLENNNNNNDNNNKLMLKTDARSEVCTVHVCLFLFVVVFSKV